MAPPHRGHVPQSAFTCRCPKEVYPHVPAVIAICLRYLTYDPNYNFDDEDEDDNAMDAEQNDEDYQGGRGRAGGGAGAARG